MAENSTPELDLRRNLGPNGGWKVGALGALEANIKVRKLQKKLDSDPLTGLSGQYPLQDMLQGLETRWKKDYKNGDYLKGTFIVSDLDGLHDVNHRYGKLAGGNDYLIGVAEALKKASRGTGRCFRASEASDEFVLYLPGFKVRQEIDGLLDDIDQDLANRQDSVQTKYPGIKFGLSYAVASFHRGYNPQTAFADANNKIVQAKESVSGERVGNVGRIYVNELEPAQLKYE